MIILPGRKQWDATAGTAENMKSAAWNSALDEVARLNRRAIPEGLLRVYLGLEDGDWVEAGHELRALLGKEG